MRRVASFVLILAAWTSSFAAPRESFRGFLPVNDQRQVFVDWDARSETAPTLVLLNGLTYDTTDWEALVQNLDRKNYNILRYDAWGQGESLKRSGPLAAGVRLEQQVLDLKTLLDALDLHAPVVLVGLSYGGALGLAFQARFPERVAIQISVAPFLGPLAAQDLWIRTQVATVRAQGLLNPLNQLSDDALYDYFLRIQIVTTYPQAEPSILRFPGKIDGVFRLVQGVRSWRVESVVPLLTRQAVHLVTADWDQYVPKPDFLQFWASLPKTSRKSFLNILYSEHKVPERFPFFLARWIEHIVDRESLAWSGKVYQGNPYTGWVSDGLFTTSIFF